MHDGTHEGGGRVPALVVAVFILWAVLWNIVGVYGASTFGHGPSTFTCLAGIGLLCALATPLSRRLAALPGRAPETLVVTVLTIAVYASLVVHTLVLADAVRSDIMVDIGRNTLEAARHFFDRRENPYATNCQMDRLAGLPHVTLAQGRWLIFGVPYDRGYPYFPVMFLAYQPFRLLDPGLEAIRYGNVVFMAAALVGTYWLAARLAAARRLAAWLAVASTVAIWALGYMVFRAGVTDLMIADFALFGFIALTYERGATAGVLFGLAMAAKLTPGALLVPILVAWQAKASAGPARWRLWLAAGAVLAGTLVPFIAWNPRAFLSATVLYTSVRHALGDDSSLWYFLPAALKTPFLVAGAAMVVAILVVGLRRRPLGIVDLVAVYFLAQLALVGFYKMIHTNYLWAVLPLGAVAFSVRLTSSLAGPQRQSGGSQRDASVAVGARPMEASATPAR
ncbi:MAG TPA: hypothetical protein VIF15_01475 [Polyangiaceae bacterium]